MHFSTVPLTGSLCLLASLVSSHVFVHHESTEDIIPAAQSELAGVVQFVSSEDRLDAPHVSPINSSAYEWWYFDVVSEDQGYNAVINFFAAPATAFALTGAPSNDILEAYLFVSTPENPYLIITPIPATKARVVSKKNGASGVWQGPGFSFAGSPDMEEYVVTIDSPQIAVKGKMSIESSAPAHYPCGPVKAGVTMEIMPHVGWANAVPDGIAHVDLEVNGTKVKFSGRGYHDKNWGDVPFQQAVTTWYWGHGHLGLYSIVWYDALTPTGDRTVSAYVAHGGKIIIGRPSGPTDTYPPSSAGTASGNFHVEIDLGDEGIMALDVAAKYEVVPGQHYNRWTGTMTGGIKGKESYTGTALYEQFSFLP